MFIWNVIVILQARLDKTDSMLKRRSEAIQLFEAPADSDWFLAIEARNCKLLLELFQADRSLWVQTGLKGRSVLHVIVMQARVFGVGEATLPL